MLIRKQLRSTLLLFILLFLWVQQGTAQNNIAQQEQESTRQLQFTLSLQPGYNRADRVLNLQQFEAAAGWSRRPDRLFEIGISNIHSNTRKINSYNNQLLKDPTINTTQALGLNAAYYVFFRQESSPLKPYISLGWATYLHYYSNKPGIPVSFPYKELNWSNSILLSPGIHYSFSRLFLKLEIPITPLRLDARFQRVENPAIPIRAQRRNSLIACYFPLDVVPLEVGIGYRISK